MNAASTPPKYGRRFYHIQDNADGTVDIFLNPRPMPMTTPEGVADYDISICVVRGVVPFDGLEEDIRRRFCAWCEIGKEIKL